MSQELEGELGLRTARAAAGGGGDDDDDSREALPLVAWDSGGASFQLTMTGGRVFEGPLGSATMTAALAERVRGVPLAALPSGNPCSATDVAQLRAWTRAQLPAAPPAWLLAALAHPGARFIGIGGATCMFQVASRLAQTTRLRAEDLDRVLAAAVGLSDADLAARDIPQPAMVVPKLVLMRTVLEWLGGGSLLLEYHETNGSCLGVAISPEFWPESQ